MAYEALRPVYERFAAIRPASWDSDAEDYSDLESDPATPPDAGDHLNHPQRIPGSYIGSNMTIEDDDPELVGGTDPEATGSVAQHPAAVTGTVITRTRIAPL